MPTRRSFLKKSLLVAAGTACLPTMAATASNATGMDTLTAIRTRRSVRKYTEAPVADRDIETLLRAAMAAPSANNTQPWEFVVIKDKARIQAGVAETVFPAIAQGAALMILTCVDTTREGLKDSGVLGVSACTQNLLLAAHASGLGAVWTASYPREERMQKMSSFLGLPKHIIPMALVVIGHPADLPAPEDRFNPARIHQEKW